MLDQSMQSITNNDDSFQMFPSKQKGQEMADNEAILLTKKQPFEAFIGVQSTAEIDTADSSKQKTVTFSVPAKD